jgi:hypothetical protein
VNIAVSDMFVEDELPALREPGRRDLKDVVRLQVFAADPDDWPRIDATRAGAKTSWDGARSRPWRSIVEPPSEHSPPVLGEGSYRGLDGRAISSMAPASR